MLGHPIDRPAAYLHRVGALIEAPAFYPTLTGEANLQMFARLGGHDRGRIPGLLEVVGLRERGGDRYSNYSLGMKQRLGIALALLPDPDLLILDEPTNGLDPQGIVEIRRLLMQLGARVTPTASDRDVKLRRPQPAALPVEAQQRGSA